MKAYHGTRISEDTIRTEGLVAPKCGRYREWMLKGLKHFNIPLEKALRNEVARSVFSKTKDPVCFTNIWVTEDKGIACDYARNSPEDLSIFLNHAGVPVEKVKEYTRREFGTPKVVTVDVALELIVDGQEPVGNHVFPNQILRIEPCRKIA